MLNGTYPNNKDIYNMVLGLSGIRHNDFKIWNLILQGHNVIAIDHNSPLWEGQPYDFHGDWQDVLTTFKH
jgi:hypothetical protein